MNPLGKTEKIVRFSLIFTALLALLAALWAGLIRIGWPLPPIDLNLTMLHGPLMINGFLGLVIGIERALALSSSGCTRIFWPYLSPICLAAGTLTILVSGPLGALLITIGSLVMVAACVVVVRRQMALFTGVMAGGALSWLIGNALWLSGQPIYSLVVWWMGFPLLTIVGERLELSRILRLSKNSHWLFGIAATIFGFGALFSMFNLDWGMRIAGIGELACALWLLRYDIARRTVNKAEKTRFIAICLLSGFGWLAVSGLLNLYSGVTYAGPFYDATLHTLFVGFAFSMIFGHALIILPAVLNIAITFSRQLYIPLLWLHTSLLLRIAGDLLLLPEVRQWGGMLNEIGVLLFLGSIGYAIRKTHQVSRQSTPAPND